MRTITLQDFYLDGDMPNREYRELIKAMEGYEKAKDPDNWKTIFENKRLLTESGMPVQPDIPDAPWN